MDLEQLAEMLRMQLENTGKGTWNSAILQALDNAVVSEQQRIKRAIRDSFPEHSGYGQPVIETILKVVNLIDRVEE